MHVCKFSRQNVSYADNLLKVHLRNIFVTFNISVASDYNQCLFCLFLDSVKFQH